MRWIVELFFTVVILGSVVMIFSVSPAGPMIYVSNREVMEQLYTNVGVLMLDPQFLHALEEAICDVSRVSLVRNMVETVLGPGYVYNMTVVSTGLLPPCYACRPVGGPLLSIARPDGYRGPYMWHASYRVVLPSGAQVRVDIGIGRP